MNEFSWLVNAGAEGSVLASYRAIIGRLRQGDAGRPLISSLADRAELGDDLSDQHRGTILLIVLIAGDKLTPEIASWSSHGVWIIMDGPASRGPWTSRRSSETVPSSVVFSPVNGDPLMQPTLTYSITRRGFFRGAALAGVAALGAPAIVRSKASIDKLNVAVIGCGGRGAANLKEMLGENVVALCDVNENNLLKAAEKSPRAKKFRDFRKLYDELKDGEFDAVVVSTTEHTHAFATLAALQRKKHVYCEKPLTHSVREARTIVEAAKKSRVVTQMGTQIHASNNYRRVVELVQGGAIGTVHEAHVWVSRAWGWQSEDEAKRHQDVASTRERPRDEMPVPKGLDWELWLGPAPQRPFHSVYVPGPKWYRWWDFGGGTMSDLGSHWIDLPYWALKLDAPLAVEARGPSPHPELAPASLTATFHYGSRGELPPVKLTWYQGTMKPEFGTETKVPLWRDGVLFVGSKGMLLADYGKHVLLPEKDFIDFQRPAKTIPDSIGHHAEWIHACKTGAPTTCPFVYSGALTEANHLGNVAYRAGKRIEWDAKTLRIPNAPDAERFLGREYRKGWKLG
jgi:predicted dehydrogenase